MILCLHLLLTSCQWGDDIQALEQPNLDDYSVQFSDTLTVQLSTVGSDSLMTGGPSRMLFGNYTDPYFGTVQCARPVFSSPQQTEE
ncbi:DUF4270 domain-containing protein [Dyadobacter chenwenxiniae]|uniref:DUF4270 domain-containing protein n=1 Tax=Dyadobacter chenwenxiniae TaxID=2906456 RepID=UPI001FD3211C|nr:DUF4270 domain-containing protein [Dyadobacter chenwenxiniae]UON86186.1 DUF4270 domain-containing protein [Dyadobacter chenwenxiniae]